MTPIVQDLLTAYEEVFPEKSTSKSAKGKRKTPPTDGEDDDEEGDHDASEVLVGILLSFLAKPSASLRGIVSHVFRTFSGIVSRKVRRLKLCPTIFRDSNPVFGFIG